MAPFRTRLNPFRVPAQTVPSCPRASERITSLSAKPSLLVYRSSWPSLRRTNPLAVPTHNSSSVHRSARIDRSPVTDRHATLENCEPFQDASVDPPPIQILLSAARHPAIGRLLNSPGDSWTSNSSSWNRTTPSAVHDHISPLNPGIRHEKSFVGNPSFSVKTFAPSFPMRIRVKSLAVIQTCPAV